MKLLREGSYPEHPRIQLWRRGVTLRSQTGLYYKEVLRVAKFLYGDSGPANVAISHPLNISNLECGNYCASLLGALKAVMVILDSITRFYR